MSDGPGRWLLEVDHGRDVGRWSTLGVSAPAGLGMEGADDVWYSDGLELDEVEIPEGDDVEIAISLTRARPLLELDDLDRLEGSPALLRRELADGSILTILRGVVADVESGGVDEEVLFSLVATTPSTAGQVPDPATAIGDATFPITGAYVLHEADRGRVAPWIIGAPGDQGTADPAEGAIAHLVEYEPGTTNDRIRVAGHRIGATSVRLFCPDSRDAGYDYEETRTVFYSEDLAGHPFAYVTCSTLFANPDEGQTYFTGIDWSTGGGLLSPRTGRAVRGWAEVVETVLALAAPGVPVDVAKLRGEAHALDRFKVDLYWDSPENALDLVTELVSMIPGLRTMRSEKGLWWRAPRWQAPSWQAVTDLVVGADAVREGLRRSRAPDGGLVNEVSVSFGRPPSGDPTGLAVYTARSVSGDARIVADIRAARSQAIRGVLRSEVEIPTWDRATAELHASGVLALAAEPRFGIPVSTRATARTERLQPGDLVAFTDRSLGLSDVPAEVEAVTIGGSRVNLDLTLL